MLTPERLATSPMRSSESMATTEASINSGAKSRVKWKPSSGYASATGDRLTHPNNAVYFLRSGGGQGAAVPCPPQHSHRRRIALPPETEDHLNFQVAKRSNPKAPERKRFAWQGGSNRRQISCRRIRWVFQRITSWLHAAEGFP